jgi:hypothetical protein
VQFYYKLRVKCKMQHVEEAPASGPGVNKTAGTKAGAPSGTQPKQGTAGTMPPPAGTVVPKAGVK